MLGTLPRRHERQFVGTGSPPPSYLQGVRSGATLFLLAAVGILAALALADALRKDDAQPAAGPATTSATTTRPKPPTLLDTLRSEAISGFVLYSDQDCRLHSLLLPRMVDDVVRNEDGGDVFRCHFHVIGGRLVSGHSSPAGKLAFRDGEIVSGDRRRPHARGSRPRRAPASQCRSDTTGASRSISRVDDLASFGLRSPVVAMTISARHLEPQYLLANFDGHTVRAVAASFLGPFRHLFLSNDGALLGAEDGTVITRTGRTIDPQRGVPAGRAVAFSPDDRWLVVLNGTSTFLVGPPEGGRPARIIRLPIPARDLVWEPVTSGTSVGPPIRR